MSSLLVLGEMMQITVCIGIICTLIIHDGLMLRKLNNPAIKSWSLFICAHLFIALSGIILFDGQTDLHKLAFTTSQIIYALRTPFLLSLFFVYYY